MVVCNLKTPLPSAAKYTMKETTRNIEASQLVSGKRNHRDDVVIHTSVYDRIYLLCPLHTRFKDVCCHCVVCLDGSLFALGNPNQWRYIRISYGVVMQLCIVLLFRGELKQSSGSFLPGRLYESNLLLQVMATQHTLIPIGVGPRE